MHFTTLRQLEDSLDAPSMDDAPGNNSILNKDLNIVDRGGDDSQDRLKELTFADKSQEYSTQPAHPVTLSK